MSSVLDKVVKDMEHLIVAIDGRDADSIEAANTRLTLSLDSLRGVGGWHEDAENLARLDHAITLAEAARIRLNLLSDMTHYQMEMLSNTRTSQKVVPIYSRHGRKVAALG